MRALAACAVLMAMSLPAGPAWAQAKSPAEYLSRIDTSGDQRVSMEEYVAWMSFGFEAMDRNRDGVLQPQEQPGGRGPVLTRVAHRANLTERFRRQDSNRDGYLDAKELAAPPR